jgi:hypothetical protein
LRRKLDILYCYLPAMVINCRARRELMSPA